VELRAGMDGVVERKKLSLPGIEPCPSLYRLIYLSSFFEKYGREPIVLFL
jgi:hypothetical protein